MIFQPQKASDDLLQLAGNPFADMFGAPQQAPPAQSAQVQNNMWMTNGNGKCNIRLSLYMYICIYNFCYFLYLQLFSLFFYFPMIFSSLLVFQVLQRHQQIITLLQIIAFPLFLEIRINSQVSIQFSLNLIIIR